MPPVRDDKAELSLEAILDLTDVVEEHEEEILLLEDVLSDDRVLGDEPADGDVLDLTADIFSDDDMLDLSDMGEGLDFSKADEADLFLDDPLAGAELAESEIDELLKDLEEPEMGVSALAGEDISSFEALSVATTPDMSSVLSELEADLTPAAAVPQGPVAAADTTGLDSYASHHTDAQADGLPRATSGYRRPVIPFAEDVVQDSPEMAPDLDDLVSEMWGAESAAAAAGSSWQEPAVPAASAGIGAYGLGIAAAAAATGAAAGAAWSTTATTATTAAAQPPVGGHAPVGMSAINAEVIGQLEERVAVLEGQVEAQQAVETPPAPSTEEIASAVAMDDSLLEGLAGRLEVRLGDALADRLSERLAPRMEERLSDAFSARLPNVEASVQTNLAPRLAEQLGQQLEERVAALAQQQARNLESDLPARVESAVAQQFQSAGLDTLQERLTPALTQMMEQHIADGLTTHLPAVETSLSDKVLAAATEAMARLEAQVPAAVEVTVTKQFQSAGLDTFEQRLAPAMAQVVEQRLAERLDARLPAVEAKLTEQVQTALSTTAAATARIEEQLPSQVETAVANRLDARLPAIEAQLTGQVEAAVTAASAATARIEEQLPAQVQTAVTQQFQTAELEPLKERLAPAIAQLLEQRMEQRIAAELASQLPTVEARLTARTDEAATAAATKLEASLPTAVDAAVSQHFESAGLHTLEQRIAPAVTETVTQRLTQGLSERLPAMEQVLSDRVRTLVADAFGRMESDLPGRLEAAVSQQFQTAGLEAVQQRLTPTLNSHVDQRLEEGLNARVPGLESSLAGKVNAAAAEVFAGLKAELPDTLNAAVADHFQKASVDTIQRRLEPGLKGFMEERLKQGLETRLPIMEATLTERLRAATAEAFNTFKSDLPDKVDASVSHHFRTASLDTVTERLAPTLTNFMGERLESSLTERLPVVEAALAQRMRDQVNEQVNQQVSLRVGEAIGRLEAGMPERLGSAVTREFQTAALDGLKARLTPQLGEAVGPALDAALPERLSKLLPNLVGQLLPLVAPILERSLTESMERDLADSIAEPLAQKLEQALSGRLAAGLEAKLEASSTLLRQEMAVHIDRTVPLTAARILREEIQGLLEELD